MDPRDDHEEDEMEMSDDERDRAMSPMKSGFGPSSSKRAKIDNDCLKVRITESLLISIAVSFSIFVKFDSYIKSIVFSSNPFHRRRTTV